jgi:hypothetical protein
MDAMVSPVTEGLIMVEHAVSQLTSQEAIEIQHAIEQDARLHNGLRNEAPGRRPHSSPAVDEAGPSMWHIVHDQSSSQVGHGARPDSFSTGSLGYEDMPVIAQSAPDEGFEHDYDGGQDWSHGADEHDLDDDEDLYGP